MVSRGLRFSGGFVLGFLVLPLAFVVWGAALITIDKVSRANGPVVIPTSFWTWGGAVTREGGASVVVTRGREVTRQTCRGTCDDLVFWHSAAERVEVRDAKGRCIVCREQGFLLPFQQPKRWSLGGNPLRLDEETAK
jgi:hypothetical protein